MAGPSLRQRITGSALMRAQVVRNPPACGGSLLTTTYPEKKGQIQPSRKGNRHENPFLRHRRLGGRPGHLLQLQKLCENKNRPQRRLLEKFPQQNSKIIQKKKKHKNIILLQKMMQKTYQKMIKNKKYNKMIFKLQMIYQIQQIQQIQQIVYVI